MGTVLVAEWMISFTTGVEEHRDVAIRSNYSAIIGWDAEGIHQRNPNILVSDFPFVFTRWPMATCSLRCDNTANRLISPLRRQRDVDN
jgi:hypothetical protein